MQLAFIGLNRPRRSLQSVLSICNSIPLRAPSGTLGPFPAVIGRYEPFLGNTFMGSRVFPSGASIDSLSTYQTPVY